MPNCKLFLCPLFTVICPVGLNASLLPCPVCGHESPAAYWAAALLPKLLRGVLMLTS